MRLLPLAGLSSDTFQDRWAQRAAAWPASQAPAKRGAVGSTQRSKRQRVA